MYRFLSLSKMLLWVAFLMMLTVASISCAGKVATYNGNGEVYVVLPKDYDSKKDLKWSEYLFKHLRHRGGGDNAPVFYDIFDIPDSKFITVGIDEKNDNDFNIENDNNGIRLVARDERTMLWLLHQYMRKIGDVDERFPYKDLPIAIMSFNDTVGHFPFKYRDVYSPTNRDEDIRGVLGLNNIDTDWGIWGHNISLTLPMNPIEMFLPITRDSVYLHSSVSVPISYIDISVIILLTTAEMVKMYHITLPYCPMTIT